MTKLVKDAALSRQDPRFMWLGIVTGMLIIMVGVFDVISSNAVLSAGSGFEVNPLHRWTQANMGAWWFIPKMMIHAVVAAMVVWFPNRAVLAMVIPIILLTSVIVLHNFQLAI